MVISHCETEVKKIVITLVFDLWFTLIYLTTCSLAKFVFKTDCLATRIERIWNPNSNRIRIELGFFFFSNPNSDRIRILLFPQTRIRIGSGFHFFLKPEFESNSDFTFLFKPNSDPNRIILLRPSLSPPPSVGCSVRVLSPCQKNNFLGKTKFV